MQVTGKGTPLWHEFCRHFETLNVNKMKWNDWCFRQQFSTGKAMLGRRQPGLMTWILLWIIAVVQDRSLCWPAVHRATTAPWMPPAECEKYSYTAPSHRGLKFYMNTSGHLTTWIMLMSWGKSWDPWRRFVSHFLSCSASHTGLISATWLWKLSYSSTFCFSGTICNCYQISDEQVIHDLVICAVSVWT